MYDQLREVWNELIKEGPFAITEVEVRGNSIKTYAAAPPSLREIWLASAAHGDKDYLVYHDERLTYAETHLDLNEDLDTIHSFELLPIQQQIDRAQERSRRLRARANGGNARHQEEPQQNGRPRLQRQQAVIEIPDQAGGAQNHIIGIYELRQENH